MDVYHKNVCLPKHIYEWVFNLGLNSTGSRPINTRYMYESTEKDMIINYDFLQFLVTNDY